MYNYQRATKQINNFKSRLMKPVIVAKLSASIENRSFSMSKDKIVQEIERVSLSYYSY